MISGVPLIPMVFVTSILVVLGMWLLRPFGVVASLIVWSLIPIAYVFMRLASRKDDHTLLQFGRRLAMRAPSIFGANAANRRHWRGLTFSPFRYRE